MKQVSEHPWCGDVLVITRACARLEDQTEQLVEPCVLLCDTVDTLPTLPTAPGEGAAYQSVGGYSSAPSGPSRPLPDHPPFKVFIGNVPYDATEDEMAAVFAPPLEVKLQRFILDSTPEQECVQSSTHCISSPSLCSALTQSCNQVVDVHIIKHKDTNKPRGCFVEFATRADLEKGLLKDGSVRASHRFAS